MRRGNGARFPTARGCVIVGAVRRSMTALCACVFAARLLAACSEGNVDGETAPDDASLWRPPTTTDAATYDDVDQELPDGTPKGTWDAALDDVTDSAAQYDGARPSTDRGSPIDPCATRADGTYCAALVGLPSTGLLRCAGGADAGVTPCAGGCFDRAGATDVCLDDGIDPCFDERDGLYCGRTIGARTRVDDAYRCMYRRTTWTGACSGGCVTTATGITCQQ